MQGWPAVVTSAQDFPFADAPCASSVVQLMPLRETQSHFIQLNIARIDAAIYVRPRLFVRFYNCCDMGTWLLHVVRSQ